MYDIKLALSCGCEDSCNNPDFFVVIYTECGSDLLFTLLQSENISATKNIREFLPKKEHIV